MRVILATVATAAVVAAQTTYSGCHNHSTVEFCYGPDGEETAVATFAVSTADLPVSVSASATTTGQTTAVTECHTHETDVFCINGAGEEVAISREPSVTEAPPASYTDCHAHGEEQYCVDPDGADVLVLASSSEEEHADESGEHDEHDHAEGEEELDCHFHAGVEHCVSAGSSESESESATAGTGTGGRVCELISRSYDIPLRVGTLFAVLVTSSIGVFAPILLSKLPFQNVNAWVFTILKQFGTGIIVSTAFVHLYTHAYLMFTNPCLGALEYEATTSAIVMAGIFLAFLFEYLGHRVALARSNRISRDAETISPDSSQNGDVNAHAENDSKHPTSANIANLSHSHGPTPLDPNTPFSVMIMESGILFHSVLIGLTLVVCPDSFYRTLLVVIIFHQFFEGLALGSRISTLHISFWPTKFFMALAFALITPLGMAIGLGVIQRFNGNDESTIIAIGTLDALSAGILVWVGVVDMWARDWVVDGGEMVSKDVGWGKVLTGLLSMITGFVLMSVLGKWA